MSTKRKQIKSVPSKTDGLSPNEDYNININSIEKCFDEHYYNESKLCLIRDNNSQLSPSHFNSKWFPIEKEEPFTRSTPVNIEFTNPHIKQVFLCCQGGEINDFSLKHFRYSVNEIGDNFVDIETKIKREHLKPCLDFVKESKSYIRDVLVHSVELMTRSKIKEIVIKVS